MLKHGIVVGRRARNLLRSQRVELLLVDQCNLKNEFELVSRACLADMQAQCTRGSFSSLPGVKTSAVSITTYRPATWYVNNEL